MGPDLGESLFPHLILCMTDKERKIKSENKVSTITLNYCNFIHIQIFCVFNECIIYIVHGC